MPEDSVFLRSHLGRIHPFSAISGEGLDTLLHGAEVRHLVSGESPGGAPGLVLHGVLLLTVRGVAADRLLDGDAFGFETFAEQRRGDTDIRAGEDSSVLVFDSAAFARMLETEPAVQAHFARRCARLEMRLQTVDAAASEFEADPFLRLEVGSIALGAPVFIPADIPVSEAARTMTDRGVAACLVGTPDSVSGILTERDLVAGIGSGEADPAVSELMTPDLVTVRRDALVFEAFSAMLRHGIRRLVVVDEEGRPLGLLQERDMLAARADNPLSLAAEVSAAAAAPDLARGVLRLRAMILRCAAERIRAENVGRLAARINDGLLARAAELAIRELGPPPTEFSLMALGSEGRREQLLATDQDNALVYEDAERPDEAYFAEFGKAFTRLLSEIGFPPCPHGVVVANAQWRLSASGWAGNVDTMTRVIDPGAVLRLVQLADARHVFGSERLCSDLSIRVMRQVRDTPVLLKYMAREALRFSPPMGFFHSLVVERSGPDKGSLNLKKGGVFPLTQGIKTLALEHGVAACGTMERLDLLLRDGVFSESMAANVRDAFEFLQSLRLRVQAGQVRSARQPDNLVRPDLLSPLERERLKDCFRVVIDFQSFLHTKFGLHLIS